MDNAISCDNVDSIIKYDIILSLKKNAESEPDRVAFRWLDDNGKETQVLTFGELWSWSLTVHNQLKKIISEGKAGLKRGDRVLLMFPPSLDFLPSLVGLLMTGMVVISYYPPNPAQLSDDLQKLQSIVDVAKINHAITTSTFHKIIETTSFIGQKWPNLNYMTQIAFSKVKLNPENWKEDTAEMMNQYIDNLSIFETSIIQYTSGSTSAPKGVLLTPDCMSGCVEGMKVHCKRMGLDVDGRDEWNWACWLPQYHDYGLIGNYLMAIVTGGTCNAMSPMSFLKNPVLWLKTIERYRVCIVAAPTFGYGLVCKRLVASRQGTSSSATNSPSLPESNFAKKTKNPLEEKKGIDKQSCESVLCEYDMSSLKIVDIAAEPIDKTVLDNIVNVLGIKQEKIVAAYGLAETVAYCGGGGQGFDKITGDPISATLSEAEEAKMKIVIVQRNTDDIVSNLNDGIEGTCTKDGDKLLEFQEVEEGVVGLVFVQGIAVTAGYDNLPELTRETFHNKIKGYEGNWLNTMDLGYSRDGNIIISGREKDLIIVNGKNIFPNDIEKSAEIMFYKKLRPGCSIAFSVCSDKSVFLCEIREGESLSNAELTTLASMIEKKHGVHLYDIQIHKKGTIPKTTSGKVRRKEGKRLYKTEQLPHPICCLEKQTDFSSFEDLLLVYGVEDLNLTLFQNGVDSLRLVRLIDDAEKYFGFTIDPNFADMIPAKNLADESQKVSVITQPLPFHLPSKYEGKRLSKGLLMFLQFFLSILIVLIVAASITIPSGFLYRALVNSIPKEYEDPLLSTFDKGPGLLLIVLPLLSMFSYTVVVICLKWLVIGEYSTSAHTLWSPYFLRWWFVDRLVNIWEVFVGNHILDTPYINVFYKLMGARVRMNSRLKTFIREPDLFTAKKGSVVECLVQCRVVDARGLSMDRVCVERNIKVKSHQNCYPGKTWSKSLLGCNGTAAESDEQKESGFFEILDVDLDLSLSFLEDTGKKIAKEEKSSQSTGDKKPKVKSKIINGIYTARQERMVHYLQRCLSPFFVLMAFVSSTYILSYLSQQLMESSSFGDWVTFETINVIRCLIVILCVPWCLFLMAVFLKWTTFNILENCTGFIVDRLADTSYAFLSHFINQTAFLSFWTWAFGTKISCGVQMNQATNICASSAHRVSIGRHTTLSNVSLRPEKGEKIKIGNHVSMGVYSKIEGNVNIGDHSGVFALATLVKNSMVEKNTVFINDRLRLSSRQQPNTIQYPVKIISLQIIVILLKILLIWIPTFFGGALIIFSIVSLPLYNDEEFSKSVLSAPLLCFIGIYTHL